MTPRRAEVYILRGPDGFLKIGYTTNLTRRLRELQVGQAEPLVVECAVPGTLAQERTLQQTFASSRLRGEWFRPDKALLDCIEYLREGGSLETFLGAGCVTAAPASA